MCIRDRSKAYFEAHLDDPTATDAEVKVEFRNADDAVTVETLTYAGDGGYKRAEISRSTLQGLASKNVVARVNVTTASATSGATQNVRGIRLVLIYDLTK